MEQIVLLLNPCFPLVFLSGLPPPFHLPTVLVKPGPQRHLLSVMGSGTQTGRPWVRSLLYYEGVGEWVSSLLFGECVLRIKYQVARELLLWLFCALSSGTARTDRKSKSSGITFQGQVYTPCKPAMPILANHVNPSSLNFFWTHLLDPTTATFPRGMENVCTGQAHRRCFINTCLSLLVGESLIEEEQLGESQRQSLDLRKMVRFSPHRSESSTRADHTSAHGKPGQSPTWRGERP